MVRPNVMQGMLALAAVACAVPTHHHHHHHHDEVDYILVGGGPGGLVLAEYLTRQKDVKVALLEAGPDSSTDPIVTSTCLLLSHFWPTVWLIFSNSTRGVLLHAGVHVALHVTAR